MPAAAGQAQRSASLSGIDFWHVQTTRNGTFLAEWGAEMSIVRNLLSYAASAATAFITLCCPQASAQTVTLAELQGAVIQFSSVVQEKIIRNGDIRYPQLRTQGHLSVGPGDTISVSMQNASGMKSSGVRSGTYTLGKPAKAGDGDDVLWLFDNGSLVRLRVYARTGATGGQKLTFAFKRDAQGLRCTFLHPIARESGVSEIRKDSSVDGVPIHILEFKQIASSCQVTKR
jgi:hypothetical protein